MANLASSDVTVLDSWYVPQVGTPAKKMIAKRVKVTLASMGSSTNKILASALGLQKAFRVTSANKVSDDVIYGMSVSYDNTFLMIKNHAAVTPLDVSGDFVFTVEGEPAA